MNQDFWIHLSLHKEILIFHCKRRLNEFLLLLKAVFIHYRINKESHILPYLAPGSYTITVNLNGCVKTVYVTVCNTTNCNVTDNTIAKSCVNDIPVLTGAALANYEYVWLKSTSGCPTQTNQAIAGTTG